MGHMMEFDLVVYPATKAKLLAAKKLSEGRRELIIQTTNGIISILAKCGEQCQYVNRRTDIILVHLKRMENVGYVRSDRCIFTGVDIDTDTFYVLSECLLRDVLGIDAENALVSRDDLSLLLLGAQKPDMRI